MKHLAVVVLVVMFFCPAAHALIINYEISGFGVVSSLDNGDYYNYDFSGNMYVNSNDLIEHDPNDSYFLHMYEIPVFDLTATVHELKEDKIYSVLCSATLNLWYLMDVAIKVFADNGPIMFYTGEGGSIWPWDNYDFYFSPDHIVLDTDNIGIIFGDDYHAGSTGISFTRVSPVPEPATLLLVSTGILGVFSKRKFSKIY